MTKPPLKIADLPRLTNALRLMGLDSGANVIQTATIPPQWEMRALLAEDELLQLSQEEVETLTQGEQSGAEAIATRAPSTDLILQAAFDGGELSDLFFEPWQNIFDARAAEAKGN